MDHNLAEIVSSKAAISISRLAKMLTRVDFAIHRCVTTMHVGGAGRYTRSICIDGHDLGCKNMAVIEGGL